MTDPRYRISAKQTAKGIWYFDATVELDAPRKKISPNDDVGDVTDVPAGQLLLNLVKETEQAFQKDGRQVVQGGITI